MFCIIIGLFPSKKSTFCSQTASHSSSRTAAYRPTGRGSSRPGTRLVLRGVAAAAATAAARWAPGTRAPGHTEGSASGVSCPHAVKGGVLVHFNGTFCHSLAKQLENSSAGICASVVTLCDQNRGSWSSQGFDICTDRCPCPPS